MAKSLKVAELLLSKKGKEYIKVSNDVTLKKGDMLSVFKPSARQIRDPETGEVVETKPPPEFLKREIVKFSDDNE